MTSSCGRRSRKEAESSAPAVPGAIAAADPDSARSVAQAMSLARSSRDRASGCCIVSSMSKLVIQAEKDIAPERLVVTHPGRIRGVVDERRIGEIVDLNQKHETPGRSIQQLIARLEVGDQLMPNVLQRAVAGKVGDLADVIRSFVCCV